MAALAYAYIRITVAFRYTLMEQPRMPVALRCKMR